ncbi:MAG: hypothetical protein ACD_65C00141G0001, partial [uncultured bacterium]
KKALGTYETDISSGAATYNYPLYLPKGRNGLAPQVSLSYNSQAGSSDSITGYGWNLSTGGSISRTKEYGMLEIYDTNEFSLNMSGAGGKLLPVSLTDDEHGEYGLQIEEAFYKYEFQTDESWLVTDQNGLEYYFGQTTDTRQDDSDDLTRIFEWYLDEIRDPLGNYVRFEYYKENGRVYPKAIYYTGFGTAESANDGPLEIRFQPFYDGVSTSDERADWTKWYDKGFEVKTEYLLSEIEILLDDSIVREYDLAYTVGENGLRSMLESITETGTSLEGDIVTLPTTEFEYQNNGLTYSYTEHASIASPDMDDAQLTDINGDGYADQAFFAGISGIYDYVYASLNGGDGLSFGGEYFEAYYTISGTRELDYYTSLLDMNSDGLQELLALFSPSLSSSCMYYNYGEGLLFEYYDRGCNVPYSVSRETKGYRFGDFNGDGLSDLFTGDETTASWTSSDNNPIYLNTGDYSFSDSGYDSPTDFAWGTNTSPGFYVGQDTGARLADINGDGLTDIVQAYRDLGYVYPSTDDGTPIVKYYLNTGNGLFVEDTDYTMYESPAFSSGMIFASMEYSQFGLSTQTYYASSNDTCFLDFNNDGIVDIMEGSNAYVWNGIDTWTASTINISSSANLNCGGTHGTVTTTISNNNDLNGDGFMDFFESLEEDVYGKDSYLSDEDKPDLLTNISTLGGAEIAITYKSALQYED